MESKPTILAFLLGVAVTLGYFLLVAASSLENRSTEELIKLLECKYDGRYQLAFSEGGNITVIDTRTGTIKGVTAKGSIVMHWDTHYVKHYFKPRQ